MSKTNIIKIIGGVGVLAILLFVYQNVPLTQAQRLNKQCQDFGKGVVTEHEGMFEGTKVSFFYSERLDTCVAKSVDELGNDYSLCDIKRNYIKQEFEDPTTCGTVFHCDKDGVDNVVLEKAEKYNGNLFRISYSEWLDNGEGGQPRAIKTPEKPYTREKCEIMFDKKLQEIR